MAFGITSWTGQSGNANSLVISGISGITAGNLLFAIVVTDGNEAMAPPTGWTTLTDHAFDSGGTVAAHAEVYYKEAVSADESASSYTFDGWSNQTAIGIIYEISGADTTPVLIGATSDEGLSASAISTATTASSDASLTIGGACFDSKHEAYTIDSSFGTADIATMSDGLSQAVALICGTYEVGSTTIPTYTHTQGDSDQFWAFVYEVKESSGPQAITGSGALAAQQAAMAGAGDRVLPGTGALSAQQATMVGAGGVYQIGGSGVLNAQQAAMAGVGVRGSSGSGTPAAQQATMVGAGSVDAAPVTEVLVLAHRRILFLNGTTLFLANGRIFDSTSAEEDGAPTGTGVLEAQQATMSGAGDRILPGTGALPAQQATMAGVGDRILSGSGVLTAQQATMAGVAAIYIEGSGVLTAQQAAMAGVGDRVLPGSGTLNAQQAVMSGAGDRILPGTGTLNAQQALMAGAGDRVLPGSGVLNAQQSTMDGDGSVTPVGENNGTGVLNAQQAVMAGVGDRVLKGEGDTGAELNADPELDTLALWTQQVGTWTATGTLNGSGFTPASGNPEIAQMDAVAGQLYRVTVTIDAVDGTGFFLYLGDTQIAILDAPGTYLGWGVVAGVYPEDFSVWRSSSGTATSITISDFSWKAVDAPAAQQAQMAGVGVRSSVGTGALNAQQSTMYGEGSIVSENEGSGVLNAQQATMSGAGVHVLTGTGVLNAQQATVAGAGDRVITGAGVLNALPATMVGAGAHRIVGSGALAANQATMYGTDAQPGGGGNNGTVAGVGATVHHVRQ